jgi:hypothetical protein
MTDYKERWGKMESWRTGISNLVSHPNGRTKIEGFENRVLSRMLRSKRGEGSGGWKKLRNT